MFLHLVDDEKFTDGTIALFEKCDPGNHRYVLIHGSGGIQPRYIKSSKVEYITRDSSEYNAVFALLGGFTAVFVYSLFNKYHLDVVNRAPQGAKLVWFFGGGELLTSKRYWKTVMLPRTRLLHYKHRIMPWIKTNIRKYTSIMLHGDFDALKKTLHKLKQEKQTGEIAPDTNMEKAIARFDYAAPVIPEDLEQLKKMTPCRAELLYWNYPVDSFSLNQISDWGVTGHNWLVGNAGRYALNHIEILRTLKKIKGHDGKIIVPLSYGDSELYKQDILKAGRKWFGERFEPLTEYMPSMEYFSLIRSCSAAFFNTPRQHAVGNIMVLLYLGAKVFLRDENPVYHFLKNNGAIVFSIQKDLRYCADMIDVPLTDDQIEKNRRTVRIFGNQSVFEAKTRKMIELLSS